MQLAHLRSFEAVARNGHFTHAADELFLSQPSLSRQIAALEAELGVALLTRGRTGATLTTEGEALLPIARRMLADAEAAREEMDEFAQLRRGRVRLGAPPTLCVSIVADALASFRRAHPGVDVVIREAGSRELVEELAGGALDLALTVTRPSVPDDPAVASEPLFTEELVLASAADGEPTGKTPMTLATLATLPLVMFHRGYDLRVATDAAFAAAGLVPTIAVEGAEMDAVLRFVERGVGVAVVPQTVLSGRPALRGDRLGADLRRTVNLSRRVGVPLAAAPAAMERFLRAAAPPDSVLTGRYPTVT